MEIKDSTQNKILLISLIIGILLIIVSIKFFGASEIPKLVEQDGYCKIVLGENWKFSELNLNCYNLDNNKERVNFTEEEFREVCPKVNFFELRLNSDCFYRGASR
jgi:hypothetical protein